MKLPIPRFLSERGKRMKIDASIPRQGIRTPPPGGTAYQITEILLILAGDAFRNPVPVCGDVREGREIASDDFVGTRKAHEIKECILDACYAVPGKVARLVGDDAIRKAAAQIGFLGEVVGCQIKFRVREKSNLFFHGINKSLC